MLGLTFFFLTVAYLAGSIPFGVLLTRRLLGVDVRQQGSGNIGATNVARVAGKKLGVLVLVLDALKGLLPVLAVMHFCPGALGLHVGVALATILGHVFPVWLRFKGGKGVATALGVLLALEPLAAGVGFLGYALLFLAFRVSSIGSLAGAALALTVAFLGHSPRTYAFFTAGVFVLLLWTHRSNIARIWKRAETPLS